MERRLILMRHATAASGANLPSDHERPLTPRGTDQARAVAEILAQRRWIPEVALVSDAARTSETWWCMVSLLGDPPSRLLPSLYGGGIDELVAAAQRLDPSVRTAIAIGHNPGWSEAIQWLTGSQAPLAPADAALLRTSGDRWSDALGRGALHLVEILSASG